MKKKRLVRDFDFCIDEYIYVYIVEWHGNCMGLCRQTG